MAHVIIPTKSNFKGMANLVPKVLDNKGTTQFTVVADGPQAFLLVKEAWPDLDVLEVPLGAGIHVMWNRAMECTVGEQHVLFLNDDVDIYPTTINGLEWALQEHSELGLVCPRYTDVPVPIPYQPVSGTCGGRYDGTGGLAGFCMMLAKDLAPLWRFDERMKWWCGDDDVLNWVRITQGREAGITPYAYCSDNASFTINNDPPPNFSAIVTEDLRIYQSKIY